MEGSVIIDEKQEIERKYEDLLQGTYQILSDDDKKLIRKAFDLAVEAHSKQRRKSGEAYIFHPIAVAKIVACEIGLGATSIASALLHDVVEDTDYTAEDIEQIFGKTIARIVSGLTKIPKLKNSNESSSLQAENFRKMLLTLNEDVRVILVKIADRLHNMQTMDSMPQHKQIRIASETLYIYAPLAHRLGLYKIKTELEDLGLKYTEPEEYNSILNKIKESKEERQNYIKEFKDILRQSLDKEGFDYDIKGRFKSIYSIRRKMRKQGVTFEEVYDKFAIRIIYKSKPEEEKFGAWKIYSIVTDYFKPNPSRLRDWISQPKTTGYEALHITVIGPETKWVEVQIRSERMDEIAEKGYAAHFKYKQGNVQESGLEGWLNRLKDTLETQNIDAVDFVEDFKLNLYSKEIYVFTPKGDVKSLPKGASALDFAFLIHTDIGLKCRGAKVNGKLVPLDYVLNSGDHVDVIVSTNKNANVRWLNFVKTSQARSKIKSALNAEKKEIAEEGKAILMRKLRHLKISYNEKIVHEMATYFNLKTSFDLFYGIGNGSINNSNFKDFVAQRNNLFLGLIKNPFKKVTSKYITKEEVSKNLDLLVFGDGEEKLSYSLSKCCKPIAGDDVFGFITINDGIKVHKCSCPNSVSLRANYSYRIMKAKWIDSSLQEFTVTIKVEGLDNKGLANKITQTVSNTDIFINSINISGNQGVFTGEMSLNVKSNNELNKLIENLKKIEGVQKVSRKS